MTEKEIKEAISACKEIIIKPYTRFIKIRSRNANVIIPKGGTKCPNLNA